MNSLLLLLRKSRFDAGQGKSRTEGQIRSRSNKSATTFYFFFLFVASGFFACGLFFSSA